MRAFGKDVPKVIPESTAWSKEQARDLDAITDVTELGCARHWCACFAFRFFSLSLSLLYLSLLSLALPLCLSRS